MSNHHERCIYPTPIDIPQQAQAEVIEMLNQTLATTVDLRTYVRQAQWNPEMNFYQPHALFDEIVAVVEEYIDLFGASLVALNGVAAKTDCLKAKLKALPDDPLDTLIRIKDHITALATRLEPYAKLLRSADKLPT